MAELVDALDLGSNVSRRAGSSPVRRTKQKTMLFVNDNIVFLLLGCPLKNHRLHLILQLDGQPN